MAEDINCTHNADLNRFELHAAGELAGVIDYRTEDGVLNLFHTGVEPEFGGRGFGTLLVEFALSYCKAAEVKVRPTCPFIAKYIEAHPEYQDLLA